MNNYIFSGATVQIAEESFSYKRESWKL